MAGMSAIVAAGAAPGNSDGSDTHAPSLRERLRTPMPSGRLWGWLGPLLVTVFAGFLRFDRLRNPHAIVFDETYYAKDSWSMLHYGVAHVTVSDPKNANNPIANHLILGGHTDAIWTQGGSFIVHPPVGKWMIAVGEWLFGMTPFGWRFSAALVGTLSVLLLARIARRMTRSTLLGCTAGLLLSLDGLHFVESRFALLDIFLMFWIVAAFGCLVIDRDRARTRLADRIGAAGTEGAGPWLGVRWWRIGAGVCLGLACATKWDGIFYVAAFGIMTVIWDLGARRAAAVRQWFDGWLLKDAIPAFVSIVVVGAATYIASWAGWFASSIGYDRHWAAGRDTSFPFIPAPLRSLWHYHAEILNFHIHLHQSHPYQSWPWEWLLLKRPVAYFYTSPKEGHLGCHVPTCSRAVLAQGTPAIWWASIAAIVVLAVWWLARRDWRAGCALLGIIVGIVPWFAFPNRTMFFFYALPALPFLVLALTLTIGLLIGRADATPTRRAIGVSIAGAYVLLVILNFAYMYPVFVGKVIPYQDWQSHMWFNSWI